MDQFVCSREDFSSTGSCYGIVRNRLCTEKSSLNPISLYGQSKVAGEKILTEIPCVILRFATVFGVSPRMRTDLLINQLVLRAIRDKSITVYEAEAKRTFIHVRDAARSIIFSLQNFSLLSGKVFNIGDESLNLTKRYVCDQIKKKINPLNISYASSGYVDPDCRDYAVSYDRIHSVGFHTTVTLSQGLDELINAFEYWEEK